nr:BPSL0761 family protein [[Pseudomonas] sp. BICA1-14]
MTMPHERTRAVIHTRDFLVELSRNAELPKDVRSSAKHLLRHYPSAGEVFLAGKGEELLASTTCWSNVFSSNAEY